MSHSSFTKGALVTRLLRLVTQRDSNLESLVKAVNWKQFARLWRQDWGSPSYLSSPLDSRAQGAL